jgi:hypothetical protein
VRVAKVVGLALDPNTGAAGRYDANMVVFPDADAAPSAFVSAFVRFANGADHDEMIDTLDVLYPLGVIDESLPAPPSRVVRILELRNLPWLMAGFLAAVALIALAHALIVLRQQHRHDFGTLRAIGFTPTQAAASVFAASLAVVLIATVIGMSLGVVGGLAGSRALLTRLNLVERTSLPVRGLVLIAIAAGATAVATAIGPALRAARSRSGEGVRRE